MSKLRAFFLGRLRSFGPAFQGLWHVLRTQPNAWIHAFFTVAVILVAAWLRLPVRDWAILVLTVGLVWAAECINTALEAIVDLASPERHPLAKIAKDAGAAAVLVAAIASVVVGLLVLGPPLWERLRTMFRF
jgi:diacylglycerol kinase (ATP)